MSSLNLSRIEILFNEKTGAVENVRLDTSLNMLQVSRFFKFLSVKYEKEHEIIVQKLAASMRKKQNAHANPSTI